MKNNCPKDRHTYDNGYQHCDCGAVWGNQEDASYIPISLRPANQEDVLITYMKAKIEERDWHAVSDAANDLRVLEARREK